MFTHTHTHTEERRDRGPKDLSDEPHYTPEHEHNPQYDHEAFLGKEDAQTFDQLSPKEAKRRLGYVNVLSNRACALYSVIVTG